ncbi:putative 2OG-Fe(II) oxygenase [Niveispirillum sp. SYP-B3756]|uniref:putative 2OG-Fe(II) oxygenase n=1 Tax=Niveispirillum sp. SYP-B3756 TaxID=2662178 RepID=UPI00156631FD
MATRPDRSDLLRDLVVALRDDQRWAEIFDLLSPRIEEGGLTLTLRQELAQAAIACEQPELALKVVDAAVDGTEPELRRQRILALYALGRIEEARMAAVQRLNEKPGDGTVLGAFANDCLTRGNAEALAAICWKAIDGGVGSTVHLAYLSAALSLAGPMSDARRLVDFDRLCRRVELDSTQVDNEELAQAILMHPALAPSPEIRPTHGRNLRLEGLAGVKHPAILNLLAIVRRQVDEYLAERFNEQHPLIANRPKTAWLQGWALVLSNDGHEETHIHSQGWLTVIYYARVPQGVSPNADTDAPPGSLTFGPWPPSIGGSRPDFPHWHVKPREGTLLIFPSFFGHGTVPTGVGDPRICVALDVIPCDQGATPLTID